MRRIPSDFLRALQSSGLDEFFHECPYVPRADYLSWIAATKRRMTRRHRIQAAVIRLSAHWREEMATARAGFAGEGLTPVQGDPGGAAANYRST